MKQAVLLPAYLAGRGRLAAETCGAVHTLPPATNGGRLVVTETTLVEPTPTHHTTHTLERGREEQQVRTGSDFAK